MHLQIALNQPLQVVLAPSAPKLQLVQTCAQGLPGGQGPAGQVADYTATFGSAASTWVVNHNLGREPAIQVLTPGGMEMEAAIVHVSTNQAQINFASPQTGRIRAV